VLTIIAGLWILAYANNVVFKFSYDTNVYSSPEEIINKYEYDGAKQIQVDDYCYIIHHGKRYHTEELLWEQAPDEYIIFNEWRELRTGTFNNFEVPYIHEFISTIDVVIHNDKYIILINRLTNESAARVFDRYGDWEYITLNDHEYYFNVLDSNKVSATYIIYVEVDGNTIELIDKDGLMGKDDE